MKVRKAVLGTIVPFAALVLLTASSTAAQELQLRIGGTFPRGDGAFWEDTRDAFALERSDFYDGSFGIGYRQSVGSNMTVGLDVSAYHSENLSSDRDFVDIEGFPILHDTNLTMVPVMVDFRLHPGGSMDPWGREGRSAGLYVGAGLGGMFWQYEEVGDFVDVDTEELFFDRFVDEGFTLAGHVLAGLEAPLGDSWGLLFEARYLWANEELSGPFDGLGEIDLSGATLSIGASYRF